LPLRRLRERLGPGGRQQRARQAAQAPAQQPQRGGIPRVDRIRVRIEDSEQPVRSPAHREGERIARLQAGPMQKLLDIGGADAGTLGSWRRLTDPAVCRCRRATGVDAAARAWQVRDELAETQTDAITHMAQKYEAERADT